MRNCQKLLTFTLSAKPFRRHGKYLWMQKIPALKLYIIDDWLFSRYKSASMLKFISVFCYTCIIFYPMKCICCDRGEQKKAVWDDTTYPTKYAHRFVSRFFLLALSHSWKIHSTDAFMELGLCHCHLDSRMIEWDGYSSYVRYLIMNIGTTIAASVMRNLINTLRGFASHWNGIMRRRVKCVLETLN